MARTRGRSRGSGIPALGGTLGSLLRTTLAQAGVVRDAIERGAREGKHRLDDARRERRREQALAQLGQATLDALRAGDAPELLERAAIADALAQVEELEQGDREEPAAWVAPPTRQRYDRGDDDDGTVAAAGWRPPPPTRGEVWRPTEARGRGPIEPPAEAAKPRRPAAEPGAQFQERRRPGGIQFEADSDDDLAEYMHPDDLPSRSPKGT